MKCLILIFLATFSFNILAQEPKPEDFFPSSVGNYWEYSTVYGDRFRTFVKDSIGENGSKYIFLAENVDPWFKIDTNYCVYVLPFSPQGQYKLYDLSADSNETWMVRPQINNTARREAIVIAIYDGFVFGKVRKMKEIGYWNLELGDTVINEFSWPIGTQFLVEGIGEYQYWSAESGPERVLRGCIIDGDTLGYITTDIDENVIQVLDFELYQNYPNPFNPSTTIKFTVPKGNENIRSLLKVYDVLGKEIATLVNEYKPPGTYEIKFDAEELANGIYFYRLESGKFFETRKMLLLK
jgi:hypothetical protein